MQKFFLFLLPLCFLRLCGSLRQALRVTLLRTLVPRYRNAYATAALTAVAHGGNPLQPFGHPTAGASLSLWEKTALLHRFASTFIWIIYFLEIPKRII